MKSSTGTDIRNKTRIRTRSRNRNRIKTRIKTRTRIRNRIENIIGVKVFAGALLLFLVLLGPDLKSQVKINSPYTRFGLGWIVENRFETRIMGMGGLRYGVRNSEFVNPANPASYSAFDSLSFIFQGGVFGTNVWLNTDQLSETGNFFSMSHLLFGFPVTKWLRVSGGVLPYSYVGYDVFVDDEIDDIGDVRYFYQGSGGLNKVYLGAGFRISESLSAGFNASFLFGTVYRERGVGFTSNINYRNTRAQEAFTSNDFLFDFGVQYSRKVRDKFRITGGLTYSPEITVNSKYGYLVTSYYGNINSIQAFRDTIENRSGTDGSFIVPQKIGAGISFENENNWTVGADFSWQNWENFELFGVPDSMNNSWNIAFGGEVTPDPNSIRSYWDRVSYRLGFRYGRSYLNFRETNLNEIGISFGFGLPLRKGKTTINIAVEAGRTGTIDNGLIQENFVRFTLGVNIFENWFIKSKYF